VMRTERAASCDRAPQTNRIRKAPSASTVPELSKSLQPMLNPRSLIPAALSAGCHRTNTQDLWLKHYSAWLTDDEHRLVYNMKTARARAGAYS
jgi:hypothetical protein